MKVFNSEGVHIKTIPENIYDLKKPLIVGLTINPEKLIQIRQSRLALLGKGIESDYIDVEAVKIEIAESRKLFSKLNCPVIDVTKRSVEETAAKIIQLYQAKRDLTN